MRKVIITVAPTGSVTSRDDTPHLPITPDEVAEETLRSYNAGASVVHLHARDPESGKPVNDTAVYKAYLERIRDKCDIVTQITTGGGAVTMGLSPEERIQSVQELKPEMASLNAGSMNFGRKLFPNPPDVIELYAQKMKEWNVVPEFEVYDVGMINNVKHLILRAGIMETPLQFSLVMGILGGIPATMKNLLFMSEALPEGCTWQTIGIGRHQIPLGAAGVLAGGNVRVGMEDNVFLSKGVLAKSNAEFVEKMVRIIKEIGLDIASPAEARKMLNIKK
ncbi:3-keto-5-aminohexanoate cleavage protein [bacterium]